MENAKEGEPKEYDIEGESLRWGHGSTKYNAHHSPHDMEFKWAEVEANVKQGILRTELSVG